MMCSIEQSNRSSVGTNRLAWRGRMISDAGSACAGLRGAELRGAGFFMRSVRSQFGFSLLEISIVTAIVLLLAIIGVPAISGYVIENKVPKVGESLARFILQTKVNAANGQSTPYADIATLNFANQVRDSSLFLVSGDDANVKALHGLGADGEVQVQAQDGGAGFSLTLTRVNHAACPSIASVMQRVSDAISVGSQGQPTVVVKDAVTPYSALTAESHCGKGDVNTFIFNAR